MAITRVGFNSGNTDNTSSVVINKPTGTIDGDVLVLFVSCDGTSGFNTPTGFTLQSTQQTNNTHTNQIFTKVADNEGSSYTFNPASNERAWVCLTTYRGVDNIAPVDSVNNSSTGLSGTDATIPSFTPTVDNCLVIAFVGHANGNAGNGIMGAWPSPLVEVVDNVNGPPGTGNASSAGAYAEIMQTTKTAVSGDAVNSDASDWGVIIFALLEGDPPVIGISTAPAVLDTGDNNQAITGFGFEASQGTGKLEIGNNAEYASCTIKVTQSIDTWADTSVQFDFSKGTLSDGINYFFITNDSGDVSAGKGLFIGEKPYYDELIALEPDIYHRFNNSYDDEIGSYAANGQTASGSYGFQSIPLTKDNTHSWAPNDNASRIEMVDSAWTNVTNTHTGRCIGGWIQLDKVYLAPSGFWEEGGGVNNIYMIIGFGNVLLGNIADSSGSPNFKVQSFSNMKLTPGRPYHVMVEFVGGSHFKLFVDGVEQDLVAGDIGADTTMSTHSGDYTYGKPDSTLDTGGTDIQYPSAPDLLMSDWATWSNAGGGLPSDAEKRLLFELGARATDEIDGDTESNMQSDIDLLADTAYVDKPLPLKINKESSGADLDLVLDNITFDDRCSIHIQYLGKAGSTLTITNTNGSNCDLSMCSTPYGGTIVVVNPVKLTLVGLQIGTQIRVLKEGTIIDADAIGNSEFIEDTIGSEHEFVYLYPLTGYTAVDISIIKPGYKEKRILNLTLTGVNLTIPIQQQFDRNYVN